LSILIRRESLPHIVVGALRLVAGLMLIQHGVQKHFGLLLPPGQPFGGAPAPMTQMWFAGTLEIVGGLLLAIGLFTRPVAFVLSGLMAFAYFLAHAPQGFYPALNGGELAALYCFVFLALSVLGGGRFSVDALRHREELIPLPSSEARRRAHPSSAAVPEPSPWPEELERRGRGGRSPRS
jgi:putative oxidoreductase